MSVFRHPFRRQGRSIGAVRPGGRACALWTSLAAASLGCGAGLAQAGSPPSPATPINADSTIRAEDLSAILNVQSCSIITLELGQTASAGLTATIPIDGVPATLDLEPRSVRAENFSVELQLEDGSLMPIEPLPPSTYRGTVAGSPGSAVAAALAPEGLYARIVLPDGADHFVEPVAAHVAGAAPNQYAVYRGDAVVASGGTCGVRGAQGLHGIAAAAPTTTGTTAAGGLYLAELALDADFEYFQLNGSDVDATVAKMETIINSVNVQYERDVTIRHVVTKIVIRVAEPDPYTTTDADALLTQLRNEWTALPLVLQPRDVVQLFTGRELDTNTIGIANLGQVCRTGSHYSLVQSDCCGNGGCSTDLSAHELGHSWNALHCGDEGGNDPNPCSPACWTETMNCSLTCSNRFGAVSISQITAFRDTIAPVCLNIGDELVRVIINTNPPGLFTVNEGDSLPLTATADFKFGADQDVTAVVPYSVDRPEIASVDSSGLLSAFAVNGDSCVTVSASFTFDGVTRGGQRTMMVLDLDAPRAIIDSSPPPDAIDARQPTLPNSATPAGWKSIDMVFNGDLCLQVITDFSVAELGGTPPAPFPAIRTPLAPREVRLTLTSAIEPGAWTRIAEITSGANVRLGFLPGDVNGDGVSDESDAITLGDHLAGTVAPLPLWATDIDRSGVATPADLLRLADLLNGGDPSGAWLGRTLPP